MEFLCVSWFVSWLAASWIGGHKGFPVLGTLLGFFMGPFGLLVIAVADMTPAEKVIRPPPLPKEGKLEDVQVAADKALRKAGSMIKTGAQRAAAKANELLNQPPPPPESP